MIKLFIVFNVWNFQKFHHDIQSKNSAHKVFNSYEVFWLRRFKCNGKCWRKATVNHGNEHHILIDSQTFTVGVKKNLLLPTWSHNYNFFKLKRVDLLFPIIVNSTTSLRTYSKNSDMRSWPYISQLRLRCSSFAEFFMTLISVLYFSRNFLSNPLKKVEKVVFLTVTSYLLFL